MLPIGLVGLYVTMFCIPVCEWSSWLFCSASILDVKGVLAIESDRIYNSTSLLRNLTWNIYSVQYKSNRVPYAVPCPLRRFVASALKAAASCLQPSKWGMTEPVRGVWISAEIVLYWNWCTICSCRNNCNLEHFEIYFYYILQCVIRIAVHIWRNHRLSCVLFMLSWLDSLSVVRNIESFIW